MGTPCESDGGPGAANPASFRKTNRAARGAAVRNPFREVGHVEVPPAEVTEWITDPDAFAALGIRSGMTRAGAGAPGDTFRPPAWPLRRPRVTFAGRSSRSSSRNATSSEARRRVSGIHASPPLPAFRGRTRLKPPTVGAAPRSGRIHQRRGCQHRRHRRRRAPCLGSGREAGRRRGRRAAGSRRRRAVCRPAPECGQGRRGMDPGYGVLRFARTPFRDDEGGDGDAVRKRWRSRRRQSRVIPEDEPRGARGGCPESIPQGRWSCGACRWRHGMTRRAWNRVSRRPSRNGFRIRMPSLRGASGPE
jgi:hypothetical protein